MLSCIYNGKNFNNSQEGYNEDDIRYLGRKRKLKCPVCGGDVYYCGKGKKINHFSHYGKSCSTAVLKRYDIKGEIHDNALQVIYEWIKNQYPEIKIVKDKYFPEIGQVADLYFEIEDIKIVLEVQFKHQNFDELNEKRRLFKQSGIKDIWIFARSGIPEPGSPYERHYYRSNNRELYYIDSNYRVFTYFKGLKRDKFDIAQVPLRLYISQTCTLDDIRLDKTGTLVLPGWREKYIKEVKELRERIHRKIRKNRELNDLYAKKNAFDMGNENRKDCNKDPIIKKYNPMQKNSAAHDFLENGEFRYSLFMGRGEGSENVLIIMLKGNSIKYKYEILEYEKDGDIDSYICKGKTNVEVCYSIKRYKDGSRIEVNRL